jgi:ribosome-associated translation inhibitor RaiA
MQAPAEKLGAFYLGAEYDLSTGQREEAPVIYDARDLTTHAVCVGMTGSGKTGLCIGLLEEAALDKVPAILIDPKGDITNLLLQFPELRPEDFRPWINVDDARRKGMEDDAYAQATAENWRNGLADWGIAPERIRDLQATTDYTIFTPGSDAGIPVSILGSLAAPKVAFDSDTEALRERISGTVAALLGLVGIDADPVRSREAILLSNIFEHFWRNQQDVDLAQLILSIQTPPVRKLGVFDVDTFYPEKERFDLAMAFNNLIAAPSFQSWLSGEAMDIDTLFFTAAGKPRHSIFYIAHLSDSERMFFVTLLLENLLTWVRRQSGTTSLRALLYFDEIFGYFPPTAAPPSKRPLLTLIKQARAFGLGVVLVTQNPVDLDYKGLTNAGTWFIGKLQAERDKERVLAGLQGAISESGGKVDVDYDKLITQLGSRVFLMHNVHGDGPVVFQTRWAQSYLRGPLTRPQVSTLMQEQKRAKRTQAPATPAPSPAGAASSDAQREPAASVAASAVVPEGFSATPPTLDPGVTQVYVPVVVDDGAAVRQLAAETKRTVTPTQVQLLYEAAILGAATVQFMDRKRQIDQRTEKLLLAPVPATVGGVDWEAAELLALDQRELRKQPERVDPALGPFFGDAPEQANRASKLDKLRGDLADWLYYNDRLKIQAHTELEVYQQPDERERDFKIRLQQVAREKRDDEVDKLRRQLETQLDRLQDRLTKQEQVKAEAEADHAARKQQEMIGIGETVLSWVLGGRSMRGLSSAASKRRMTAKAGQTIAQSEQAIAELQTAINELEQELKEQTEAISLKWATLMDDLTTEEITPRRSDVNVDLVALAWLPQWLIRYDDGTTTRTATVAAYQLPAVG